MPDFTIIAVTTTEGSQVAEVDGFAAEFDDASEGKGYARRQAEETLGLAGQLNLDFNYSHVSVFEGVLELDEATPESPALIGMWLFALDGVDWVTAADLRKGESDLADDEAA